MRLQTLVGFAALLATSAFGATGTPTATASGTPTANACEPADHATGEDAAAAVTNDLVNTLPDPGGSIAEEIAAGDAALAEAATAQ